MVMPLKPYSASQPPLYPSPDDPTLTQRVVSTVKQLMTSTVVTSLAKWLASAIRLAAAYLSRRLRSSGRRLRRWRWRDFFNTPNACIILWILLLWWGEKVVFEKSIESCRWETWEDWEPHATPHHLVLVADPQLVDPHTYPGRPWPLSTLTVKHTDMYMYRSYSLLQRVLEPDSVVFLGDLFDGGREWSTPTSSSPEKRYQSYGNAFWSREFDRFARIFFNQWRKEDLEKVRDRRQNIIASLPGNHDLGLGVGIQIPVRNRFVAFFGDGNRVDVLGNHTFVSIDTVSLSAFGQADPQTASQGSGLGDGPEQETEKIWRPAMHFLDNARYFKQEATKKELAYYSGIEQPVERSSNEVISLPGPAVLNKRQPPPKGDLPTVLLTHVPLYRSEGTPCGPLREHWPPSPPPKGQTTPLEKDDRNAISVRGGYQYQNVLTPGISKDLLEKIGNVGNVFSGDDHDYCEVVHRGYTSPNSMGESSSSGIREITVKSISWAMGVRKPGFLMVSLWNPINLEAQSIRPTKGDSSTLKTHLCLLPDQLAIFIRYAILIAFTLFVLLARAITVEVLDLEPFAHPPGPDVEQPLLPISKASGRSPSSAESEKAQDLRSQHQSHSQSSSNSSQGSNSGAPSTTRGLFVRSSAARTRSLSPASGYGIPASQVSSGIPLIPQAGLGINFGNTVQGTSNGGEKWSGIDIVGKGPDRSGTISASLRNVVHEAKWSIWRVFWVVILWYLWLARNT